ncbi:MAG: hypothetical protein AAGB06_02490 [Verrucomicrobiota bacterium]
MTSFNEKYACSRLRALFAGVFSLLFGGCVAVEEATISGRTMSNGQVGYSGYFIEVPPDYISIDDPSQSGEDFSRYRELISERVGSYNINQSSRDSHFFVCREKDAFIRVSVEELRGRIKRPLSFADEHAKGKWYAIAQSNNFTHFTGSWEKFTTAGTASFLKSGSRDGDPGFYCAVVVYGGYNEGFFIEGYTSLGSMATIRGDVIATAMSLEL